MNGVRTALLIAAAALVSGCEAKVGTADGNGAAPSNVSASAEGKAEEGKIAFSAPGIDLKLQVPLQKAEPDTDNRILYPGARLTGMYIAAHPDSKDGSDGEVELRFATPDAPDKVAAWYRDPARAPDFRLSASAREGAGWTLAGTEGGENGFRIRLEPKGAGTDGRLVIGDRN